jgi:hypothetical protein
MMEERFVSILLLEKMQIQNLPIFFSFSFSSFVVLDVFVSSPQTRVDLDPDHGGGRGATVVLDLAHVAQDDPDLDPGEGIAAGQGQDRERGQGLLAVAAPGLAPPGVADLDQG